LHNSKFGVAKKEKVSQIGKREVGGRANRDERGEGICWRNGELPRTETKLDYPTKHSRLFKRERSREGGI